MSPREDLIARYLARALDERERGSEPDLETLCSEHPDIVPEVAAALDLHGVLPGAAEDPLGAGEPSGILAGRYRLDAVLGRGASGSVFLGRDLELDRDVAVKVLRSGVPAGEHAVRRFLREAEVLARLEHPHVVRVYDRGQDEGGDLFLVTERLQGCSLSEVLEAARRGMRTGPSATAFRGTGWLRAAVSDEAVTEATGLRQLVQWTLELGTGLQAAHAQGVLHRDVKPSNAWVRSTGGAVVLDFGLAARAGDPALTTHGAMLGTPWYMAPEQAAGKVRPQPTIDVYGLCATLYHLLTLRPPHPGSFDEVLASLREGDPVPAARLHPGLPRDLQAILDKGLEREPARRYPGVAALAEDLRAFLEHRPVRARPISPLGRAVRRVRRRPARAAAVALGASAALLLFVAVPLWQREVAATGRAERQRLFASLPSQIAIEGGPDQRLLQSLDERQRYLADLDRLLELDPGDVPTRLLRASVRLDGGDHAGARADLAALAERSPYLAAVARRYAEADDSRAGIDAVLLADLPEPASPEDEFVAGFHALRARDGKLALELLNAAVEADPDYLPARDLRLLALLDQGRGALARDEANHLEGRYGRPTARTQHAIGVSLLMERKYASARPYLEESLRLRPDRHGPLTNLGLAHLRLGNLDEAGALLRQAVELRPWFDNSRSNLAQVLREMERYDEARAVAGELRAGWWRLYDLANIDLAAALAARAAGDQARFKELATAAAEGYARSLRAAGHRKRGSARNSGLFARALAEGDNRAALVPFLLELRRDPCNAMQIVNLAELLKGQSLDEARVTYLRLFLLEQAWSMAPEDPRPRDHRNALLKEMQGR